MNRYLKFSNSLQLADNSSYSTQSRILTKYYQNSFQTFRGEFSSRSELLQDRLWHFLRRGSDGLQELVLHHHLGDVFRACSGLQHGLQDQLLDLLFRQTCLARIKSWLTKISIEDSLWELNQLVIQHECSGDIVIKVCCIKSLNFDCPMFYTIYQQLNDNFHICVSFLSVCLSSKKHKT